MSPKHENRTKGTFGEEIGDHYLKQKGYRILERNARSPFGEIDAVALHHGVLVFVEIKTRMTGDFGLPEEAVDGRKQSQLARLASWYLARHPNLDLPVRFDVLAIGMEREEPEIRLIQNAFELEGSISKFF